MFISYFHVYRPLTPPYVPFGIRRFLFWIPFEVRIQQTAVACSTEIIRGSSHVHNRCTTYSPITLTISPLTCVIFFDTTFPEVLYSGLGEFPRLPYTRLRSFPCSPSGIVSLQWIWLLIPVHALLPFGSCRSCRTLSCTEIGWLSTSKERLKN